MGEYFKLKKYTTFKELIDDASSKKKKRIQIPTSDLCIQDDGGIFQFEFVRPEDEEQKKVVVKPKAYNIARTPQGTALISFALEEQNILEEVVNSAEITKNIDAFFNNLHVYEEFNRPKVRKLLLWSEPGLGKTSTIMHYCKKTLDNDKDACVIIWPTNQVGSGDVSILFNDCLDLKKCSKLILVIEDVGGTGAEGSSMKQVDQNLLDLLQGVRNPFTVPTIILATTNYPQNLITALTDRPGRFDKVIQLLPPSVSDVAKIVEFITKKKLTEDDKAAIALKEAKGFSIAHIIEALVRSRIHNMTMTEAIKELFDYRKKVKKNFSDDSDLGFSGGGAGFGLR